MDTHFGNWLRDKIDSIPSTIAAFCRDHDLPRQTVNGWLYEARPGIRGDSITRLARALGVSREEIKIQLGQIEPSNTAA
jgi:pyrroloquinoline quinone (PQQ) biosynthesis protein C